MEPVFANLRYNKAMDRFTYRGKKKVNLQWLFYCLVHNLEKLAHLSTRFGRPKKGNKGSQKGSAGQKSLLRLIHGFINELLCFLKLIGSYFRPQPLATS